MACLVLLRHVIDMQPIGWAQYFRNLNTHVMRTKQTSHANTLITERL